MKEATLILLALPALISASPQFGFGGAAAASAAASGGFGGGAAASAAASGGIGGFGAFGRKKREIENEIASEIETLETRLSDLYNIEDRTLGSNHPILGGIQKVEKLSPEHLDIVGFGLAQLTGKGCNKKFVRVENFGEQPVTGTLYHFDVVRQCDGEAESVCHMKVVDVPWQGGKKVLWGKTTCE